jgi:hypothetical protein
MKGTEKQVKWAEKIREEVSAKLDQYRGLEQDEAIDLILAQEDSRFWIDSFGRDRCAALKDPLYAIAKVAAYIQSDIADKSGNKPLDLVFDPEINLARHFEPELEEIYRSLQMANRKRMRANR